MKRRSKSPDNEEILALFRRIQSSISKEREAKVPRTRRHAIADSLSADSIQSTGMYKFSKVASFLARLILFQ